MKAVVFSCIALMASLAVAEEIVPNDLISNAEWVVGDQISAQDQIDDLLSQTAEGPGTDVEVDEEPLIQKASSSSCSTDVKAVVNKASQTLSVYLDCSSSPTYVWKVSTGVPGHGTPNFNTVPSGRFGSRTNSSSKYPGGCTVSEGGKKVAYGNMPYAVYFKANGNYAIHGTCAESKLGTVQSHGCIRITRANAALFQNIARTAYNTNGSSSVKIIVN